MDRRIGVALGALVLVAVGGLLGWGLMSQQLPNRKSERVGVERPKPEIRVGAPPAPSINAPPAGREQVVVKYNDGVSDERISAFEASHGLTLAKEIAAVKAKVYDVPDGHGTKEVIGWFLAEPGLVAYAERNGTMQAR